MDLTEATHRQPAGFAELIGYDGDGRARQRRSDFDTPTV